MPNTITIHAKRESSLFDVETQFKTKAIRTGEGLPHSGTEANDTQASPDETHLLIGWEVFRNELEFE